MTALRNPDDVWPAETMAEIVARLGKQHEQQIMGGIQALEAKLEAFRASLDVSQNGEK